MNSGWGLFREYQLAEKQNTLFLYKGAISQLILSEIAESIKHQVNAHPQIVRKFFGIFIELAQNIRHHSDERTFLQKEGMDVGVGILRASVFDDYYQLVSGNYVERAKGEKLMERSAYINDLDAEGLRHFYRQERKRPKITNQKGANVGLIDMVRRSHNPIKVEVEQILEDKAFVSIAVQLDRELPTQGTFSVL